MLIFINSGGTYIPIWCPRRSGHKSWQPFCRKVRTVFQTEVTEEHTANYDAMKETLLASFGITTAECRSDYWFLRQGAMETMNELSVWVKRLTSRYGKGCGTVEELQEPIALGRLLSLIPASIASQVRRDKPKSTTEVARLAETL